MVYRTSYIDPRPAGKDRYRGLQYGGTIEAEWKTERISDLLNPKSQNDLLPNTTAIADFSKISQGDRALKNRPATVMRSGR